MPPSADPATVPGLPESTLKPEHLAVLPTGVPPGPWECQAQAMMWVQRATPPSFDWAGRPIRIALAGFVHYQDTPVGPYHEVLAGSLVRTGPVPRLQVPFMAVDSLPSVAGGRVNWALPKTMADFETDLDTSSAQVKGDGWSISVQPVRSGRPARRIPLWSRFSSVGPLGTYATSLRATGRLVRVQTQVDGETLGGWLGSVTHLALVFAGRMRITAPRPN